MINELYDLKRGINKMKYDYQNNLSLKKFIKKNSRKKEDFEESIE